MATEETEVQEEAQSVEEAVAAENAAVASEKRRKRAAKLLAAAEAELTGQPEVETADPAKLKVDNEVLQAMNEFNEVYVSNAQEDHKYIWIFRDPYNEYGGRFVRRMQALGWKVVGSNEETDEAKEHKHVDNTRVVADCLLMKIRLDRYVVLQRRDQLLREAQQAGVYANVFDIADRTGVRVWDQNDMPDAVRQGLGEGITSQRQARALGRFHQMNRAGGMNKMLKEGTIPGLPPGVRRVAPPSR